MLRNYFKVALRNIARHKAYTFINVAGLAAGMACCIVIFLYVTCELTYDAYHEDADRVFRVAEHRTVPVGEFSSPHVCPAVAPAIMRDFSQVAAVARLDPITNGMVQRDGLAFYEDRMFYADAEVLDIFTIPFIYGDRETALERPKTVVITERMARKYFGEANPVGRMLGIKDPFVKLSDDHDGPVDHKVTGVIKDPPSNTHFKYDIIVSLQALAGNPRYEIWDGGAVYTYVKLKPGVEAAGFEDDIRRLAYRHYGEELTSWGQDRNYFLQPLRDIHFHSDLRGFGFMADTGELEPPGNMVYVYVYSCIGLLVLLIGCMNFINLSNARSVKRAREVGLRKVVGASRSQLVGQFLGESMIVTLLALVSALALVEFLLPIFNQMAGTGLTLSGLAEPPVLLATACLIFLVGGVAGGYPVFVLTAYRPAQVLKGSSCAGRRGSFMLKSLVIGQFAISIFLAIASVAVYRQLDFMRGQGLGFDKEHKLVIPFRLDREVRSKREALKSELLSHSAVTGATVASSVPGDHHMLCFARFPDKTNKDAHRVRHLACDYDYVEVFDLQMAAGRSMSAEEGDRKRSFLINETAARTLGFDSPQNAVGQVIRESFSQHQKEIVGVVQDYHIRGMQDRVEPVLIEYTDVGFRYNLVTLNLVTGDLPAALEFVESKWREMFPGVPYEGYFLDEAFDRQYQSEAQVARLLLVITSMGLSIACLGLLGLASFMAQQRTREIGVRKVLGASVISIVRLLSGQYALLVIAANLIAWPAAYYVLDRWLQDFAYRINIGLETFLTAGAAALLIALATVSIQAVKVARANPVEALKHE